MGSPDYPSPAEVESMIEASSLVEEPAELVESATGLSVAAVAVEAYSLVFIRVTGLKALGAGEQ